MSPLGLAQRGDLFVTIAPWLGVLVVVILVGGVLAMWIKRRFLQADQDASSVGFTLSDLREMARTGEISAEEFEAARLQMIERVRGSRDDHVVPDPEKAPHGERPG